MTWAAALSSGRFDPDGQNVLPPKDEAQRLVALIGGREKVIAAAKEALGKNEYAWAAQLVNYVYWLDPNDQEARAIMAGWPRSAYPVIIPQGPDHQSSRLFAT
jgi:alkyl sulfatase BDS1-like metallo-beta-lactamase superfamily hydrolase